jgi:polynucleotide 5'-hydroxyl-kinase GRC3/NOL9
MVDRLVDRGGTVALLGGIDTGKTSFGLSVAEEARARGKSAAYIDADVGQSTIGPPTCVGLKYCKGLEHVDKQSVEVADELAFVGSSSPRGHLLPLMASTFRLVIHAREAGSDLIIVDTSGLITGVYAELLKYYKLELIHPDSIIGFQRGEELEPILGVARRLLPAEVVALRVASAVVERSVDERMAYREERLRSYFSSPLSKWRVKPSVFMPTIPTETDLSLLDGLLVGLENGNGTCLGIGLLEYDTTDGVLRMVSPVRGGARGLRLGSLKVSKDGKVIGRVTLRDLFGE